VNRQRSSVIHLWPVLLSLLLAGLPARAQAITRGPYVQLGTPTSMIVRWRTDIASDSRVRFGASAGSLTSVRDSAAVVTEHEVRLDGLTPGTRYYYSVGSTTLVLAGGDANHFFQTSPTPGTRRPYRVWVLGDSGTGDSNARAVRDTYAAFNGTRFTDLWLMLGDNAYSDGTDAEYQTKLFDIYPQWLRQSVLWPTLGNHDGHSAFSATQTGPYYDSFTLPRAGEAGGVASGTEAYYSFDFGNIHFICLDSSDSDRSPGGPMLTWLEQDLAANTRDWTIAFWHHPPYSKGSHDSDSEGDLVDMRENALPILESWGVDLVLAGHSHSYERSFLLDSHYGVSSTLTESMKLDAGDGRTDGTGAYFKATVGPAPHEGAVHVVAGSSGKTSGGSLDHPVMVVSLNVLGSVVLDVDGDRLDAKFLDNVGAVRDYFTVLKGAGTGPRANFSASPTSGAAPLAVTFTDLSTGAGSWAWDFDNNGTTDSTQRNPSYTYASPGTYSVRLSVTGATGADDEIKTGYITVTSPPVCGNGIREGGEQCDGADLGGATCASQNCAAGTPTCSASCTLSYASCTQCQVCGNGVREGSEQCDGSDLGGATCASRNCSGGTPTCSSSCGLSYASCTGCQVCGNNVREGAEVCDGSDLGGRTCQSQGFAGGTLGCLSGCSGVDTSLCTNDPNTILARVAAGSDDAEESATGSVSLTSGDLELVYDGSNQVVGLRFTGLAIPRAATIQEAWVQFTVDEAQSEVTQLTIQGQAADNAPTFASSSTNVSGRVRTSASVSWSPAAWNTVGDAGADQRTPNLAPILQEIVNRPGWNAGNSLALLVSGTGHRTADAYDGSATAAPLLRVRIAVASTPPPNVSGLRRTDKK